MTDGSGMPMDQSPVGFVDPIVVERSELITLRTENEKLKKILIEMKRYVIFAFETYYPCGGLEDLLYKEIGKNYLGYAYEKYTTKLVSNKESKLELVSFDTIEEAKDLIIKLNEPENFQIVDLTTLEIVYSIRRYNFGVSGGISHNNAI